MNFALQVRLRVKKSGPMPIVSGRSPLPTLTATPKKIKGQGDSQAARIYNESFGRDPQFAQFYRSLDAYKASFAKKSDVMVLDPSGSDFFRTMRGNAAPSAAQPVQPAQSVKK